MMNKIYKVIWNAALQCWVAVSELGKAKGKTKSKKVLSAAAVMAVSAVGVSTNTEAAVNYATGKTFGGGMAIGSSSNANTNAAAYGHGANARALEDVAIGYKTISGAPVSGSTSHSSAQASVAVGTYANATHVATTAIGAHASAINNFATAVGAGALANKENGSAFGQGAMATGVYATALGKGALAKQDYSVALGKEAAANTQLTTSIGSKTNATGFSAIAIGSGHVPATGNTVIEDIQGAQATADDSMAVGASALANREGATALGKLSKATNNNAVAVGPDSVASGSWATATGASANASGQASAAFGESARAGGKKSIATGSHASASGENAIASGANAIATKNGATAVGANTEASGDKATALGDLAKAKNNRATALGHDSQATGEFSTAAGVSSRASGIASVATGKNATASGSNAIATGNAANATGTDSIASGRQASATGTGAVATGAEASASGNAAAYGNKAKATGGWSSAFGNEAKATQSDASAFGNSANAGAQNATAVGAHSSVTASGGTALGRGSSVAATDGVALGNGAVANRAARDRNTIVINTADPSKTAGLSDNNNGGDANTVYAPVRLVDAPGALEAIKNTINGNKGAVSVGDSGNTRQIINVAAGSADSDAVNVAQLKAVAGSIKKYSVTSPDGSITITNSGKTDDPQNFQIKMNTTAVQDAAQWYVKEGNERSGTAVRGGNTVSFNDSSTVDVQHNNKNFTFNVKSGDVTANTNTGAITAPTDGNVLAKAKNVAEAIQRSGWELQANGTKVGLVNPGDKVNIKAGTGVTITPTNEANGISTLTISAAQQNYSWKLKEDSQTAAQALNVTNNTAVSLKGENYLNITNRNGGNFAFKTVTADVGMNTATGATNQATATGLTTNKAVADAIAKSGFQLKENGTLKNVVNPGESLNFKPGQGTTVSVGTNGDVQVNANVADIQAGNNVTVTKGNNGVVTINAKDTNTQASVANGTGLTLTESNNSNGTKKYTLGVNVDNNTIKVENGKLVANLSGVTDTNTQSTVEAKANNFVTVDGSTKNTNGTTKYQVGVTTGDVAVTEATGAVTAISAATGVATNKTVADAIAKSGFQLQENGTLRNVVNPGEILNFKPGKGTTVSVGKNGDVQINANVAGITAGKNISTTTDANGNVTINAKDTSAHVKAANNAAVKVDKATTTRTENNADITDYTVDLTDQTKTNITHGVNANETVTNKGLTFVANKGNTGIKKLGSTVDVKGNTSNNVITTTANTNGITVDYNGTAAAQVTSLTYKANNANAKSVTLAKGLDFTNGTQTTAEVGNDGVVKFNVNTTTLSNATGNGNIQAPTGANSDGLVTAKNVANAINTSGWNLQANNVSVGLINPSDKVSFDAGNGVTVTSTNEANGVSHIKVAAKVDGSTITVNDQGQLVANLSGAVNTQASLSNATSSPITIATKQNTNGTNNYTVDVNVDGKTITKENGVLKAVIPSVETVTLTVNTTGNNAGKVEAPTTEADKKKLVTAENVAKAINESYWVAKRGDSVTTNADSGDGDSNIAAGNNVTFVAGKNMALQKAGNKFIYATKDDVTFNNVTANNTTTTNLTVKNGGNVDMGGNKVENVANGTISNNSKDAVNGSQLYAVDNKFNNTVTLGGENNSATEAQKLNKDGGLKFNIVGAENGNITTTASGTDVKIDLTEGTKKDIKQGVDANTTVTNKGLTFNANTGNTGAKKLGSEVDVKGDTANNVITTNATEAGITINYNGTEAAKVTHLTYKANDGTGKTVKLSEGLNFKNGTQTTAEVGDNGVVKFNVNTTTLSNTTANGKITVPDGNGLVTAKEVANAINAASWNLNVSGATVQNVKAGDFVSFANGNGTTVTYKDGAVRVNANVTDVVSANGNATITRDPNTGIVTVNAKDTNTQASVKNGSGITVTPSTNANGTANYTVAVNVDGSTITVNNDGKLVANVPDTSKVSLTNNAGKVGDVSAEDANKLVTGDNLAKTINATYWKASQGTHEETTSEETTGAVSSEIKPGDELTFVSGKNMALKKDGNKFVYATKDDVTFNNVTTNNLTVNAKGNVDMGGNQVHNVANGTKGTDAVNLDQLNATTATANAGWVIKANGTNATTVKPNATVSLNNTDGNILITKNTANNNVTFNFNPNATFGVVGKDGKDGVDGSIGVNGKDGASVVIDGKDGSIGLTGPKGKDGVSVTLKPEKGTTTVNAKDDGKEIERIKYTANGTTREVATLDDGLKFKGDSKQVINRTLGSQMNITGGADETTLTDNNIGVVYDKATDGLKVKLAKDVNLTSNGSVTIGNTTLNNNGFTITNKADPSKTVSVTDKGLNNGGNTIINVAPGVNGTDAVNLDQLNATTAIANAGWVIKANGTNATTVKPNATVSLNNTDGNILITKNTANNNVTFNFNPNATFGVVGKDGKDGVDGSIGVNGKDGSSVVINGKDGSIGLNGKDGKNGLSIKGDQGPAGVDGKDGETKTRIVYEYADPKDPNKTIRENVATLNDGLRFTGNNGVENAHRLNTLVTIVGEGVDKAASANFTSASGNINVKADGKGTLEVQLAKNLKNIETINNGNSTITLNKDGGTTISGGDVSVAGNKVTNVKDGDVSANSKDAINGSQLYHVMTNATAGWNLSVNNGKDKGNVKPGAQVDLNNTDGNIIISKNANNVTFNFNPNATFGVKGKDGKDGVDGSIGVNSKNGSSVVIKDGSIGLTGPKGADGKDGASANMSVQKGTTTVNTDRDGGKEVTRIVYTDKDKDGKDIKREVATLDDGLKFKGDSEQVINRTLGSQMNITGGADSTKLTDNNIGVVYDEATNGLKVKLSKDVDLGKDGSITIGGTQVTNNGLTIKNGPSVTEKGVDAGNKKVTNVADGDINETSKDAVNGSQLYQAVNNINKNVNAAKTELEEGDNVTITSRVGNNGQTIYKVSSTDNSAHVQGGSDAVSVTKAETTRKDGLTTVTDYTVDLSSKTKDDIKKGVDAHDTVTNKGLTFNADKGTTGAKKLGSQVAVNGDNKNIETVADTNGVKVKLKDDINVNSVTANTFKAGDTIVNTKGVQVSAKDDRGNNTNVVINEKGINAGNTRIQNVAAGRADTDAVNVSQLKGAVTQIGNHINKMDKNLRAGIAGAMAAGGLYHATLPGKSMVSAGAGTYKGESAVAVGYSRLSDNGKVGIKFSVNTNTRGDSGAAASVGYQW